MKIPCCVCGYEDDFHKMGFSVKGMMCAWCLDTQKHMITLPITEEQLLLSNKVHWILSYLNTKLGHQLSNDGLLITVIPDNPQHYTN